MEAKPEVSFRSRARARNGKSRKRPRSPAPKDASGEEPEVRVAVRSAAREKPADAKGKPASEARTSWRVEYKADTGDSGAAASARATAARHGIDEADGTRDAPKKGKFGPLRAPAHIRTSVVTDMQPDVCKDYMETGYCGFGDSCKFLHDRSLAKKGWMLDKEWGQKEAEKRWADEHGVAGEQVKLPDVGDDGLPFSCYICRNGFTAPVVTLCEHYFCESCAVERMAADSTCAVCRKQLRGTLNTASKLVMKLKAQAKA